MYQDWKIRNKEFLNLTMNFDKLAIGLINHLERNKEYYLQRNEMIINEETNSERESMRKKININVYPD